MLHVILFPTINLLYLYIITPQSICAVLSAAVFRSSLTSSFPSTLFRYFLDDFEVVRVAHHYYWYHFYFHIPHNSTSIVRFLCLKIFSTYFLNHISISWNYNAYWHKRHFFYYHRLWCWLYCCRLFCQLSLLSYTAQCISQKHNSFLLHKILFLGDIFRLIWVIFRPSKIQIQG